MNQTLHSAKSREASGYFKVSVSNFGPIETASVDLKPLSVFVGKSNTGKTYLATLIYVLHQELRGFPSLPYSPRLSFPRHTLSKSDRKEIRKYLESISKKKSVDNLPDVFFDYMFSSKHQQSNFKKNIIKRITTTFEEKDVLNLRFSNTKHNSLSIRFGYLEKQQSNWTVELKVGNSRTSFDVTVSPNLTISNDALKPLEMILKNTKGRRLNLYSPFGIIDHFFDLASYPELNEPSEAHFLPAVRGGIMQSHRFVASAALDRITYAGLEDTRIIPRLPKTSIDFIQKLLSVSDRSINFYRLQGNTSEEAQNNINSIADKFESLILDGKIESNPPVPDGYPEMYFHPSGSKKKLALSQSSSMVTELAPIIVFIRNFVKPYDLLILEEPEAHLHPAAQVTIAECIAALVRSNVNVLVTTHSDWFLKCLHKLILKGQVRSEIKSDDKNNSNEYLLQSEVGVWNFVKTEKSGTKVKEIEFDADSGVEPADIEDVTFSLYNEVVQTRNTLASTGCNQDEFGNGALLESQTKFTPRDIAHQMSISVKRVQRKLRQLEIEPKANRRYFFTRSEFDNLCDILSKEFGL